MIKIKTCYTVANPKFSLKDSNAEFSAIRMRVFINKVRLNIHLPAEYKIKPCHWDNATGRAIEDPKRNLNLKGNPFSFAYLINTLMFFMNLPITLGRYSPRECLVSFK